jgi:DNA mismatch endonuclease (patch repair protein)
MVDSVSEEQRSWNMSRIRSKDTKPELIVRKMLHKRGIRYRIHTRELPGNPDLSNKNKKFAVFVNGCFWHQHKNCKRATVPKSNISYWIPKLQRNVKNLNKNITSLKNDNWKTFVIWECEVNDQNKMSKFIEKIKKL